MTSNSQSQCLVHHYIQFLIQHFSLRPFNSHNQYPEILNMLYVLYHITLTQDRISERESISVRRMKDSEGGQSDYLSKASIKYEIDIKKMWEAHAFNLSTRGQDNWVGNMIESEESMGTKWRTVNNWWWLSWSWWSGRVFTGRQRSVKKIVKREGTLISCDGYLLFVDIQRAIVWVLYSHLCYFIL